MAYISRDVILPHFISLVSNECLYLVDVLPLFTALVV